MIFKYSISNLLLLLMTFLLQVTVFSHVDVYGLGFPMVYMMAILFMPILQPVGIVIMAGFLTGLGLDFFSDTGGLHTAAMTFMAFSRVYVLNKLEPQAGYTKEDTPGFRRFGAQWVTLYILILVLLHHSFYFIVEEGSLVRWSVVLLKVIVSSVLSTFLIILLNLFLFRR